MCVHMYVCIGLHKKWQKCDRSYFNYFTFSMTTIITTAGVEGMTELVILS